MIWISSEECESQSFYFEPRDVDLSRRAGRIKALVTGLVGNGNVEFPCEVALDQNDSVTIFPIWTELGVEALPEELESQALRRQLMTAVREMLPLADDRSRH
jgi:hypothetical protein